MANLPSLRMVPLTQGIQTAPVQQRVLDFTPLLQSLATMKQTAPTEKQEKGTKTEMPWEKFRIGYARQLQGEIDKVHNKIRSLEMQYTPEVASTLPEYQRLQRELEIVTSPATISYGIRETERENKFKDYIHSNKIGENFNLEAAAKGFGLKRNDEWLALQESAYTSNIDPNNPNNSYIQDFPTAPNPANMETARAAVDALFSRSEDKFDNKDEFARIFADAVSGIPGLVLKTESGGSGDNYAQIQEAHNQTLRRLGMEGDRAFDLTDPMVYGYLQSWFKQQKIKGNGVFDGDGNLLARTDQWGLTSDGINSFSKFVEEDIASHYKGRKQSYETYDLKVQQIEDDRAFGMGVAAEELADLASATTYQAGVGLNEYDVYSFTDLFDANLSFGELRDMANRGVFDVEGMKPQDYQQYQGILNADMPEDQKQKALFSFYREKMATGAIKLSEPGKEYMKKKQEDFDQAFVAKRMINIPGQGEVEVSMYEKITDEGTGEVLGYRPTAYLTQGNPTAFAQVYKNDLQEKIRQAQEAGDAPAVESLQRQLSLVDQKMSQLYVKQLTKNPNSIAVLENAHVYNVDPQWIPQFTDHFSENMLGQEGQALRNTIVSWGSGYASAQLFGNAKLVDIDKNSGSMVIQQGPGLVNMSVVRNVHGNLQSLIQNGFDVSVNSDNVIVYNANGKPFMHPVNSQGKIDVQGLSPDANQGFLYPIAGDEERNQRNAQTKIYSQTKNPQAFNHTNAQAYLVGTWQAADLSGLSGATMMQPTPFKYSDAEVKNALASVNSELLKNQETALDKQKVSTRAKDAWENRGLQGVLEFKYEAGDISDAVLNEVGLSRKEYEATFKQLTGGHKGTAQDLAYALGAAKLKKEGKTGSLSVNRQMPRPILKPGVQVATSLADINEEAIRQHSIRQEADGTWKWTTLVSVNSTIGQITNKAIAENQDKTYNYMTTKMEDDVFFRRNPQLQSSQQQQQQVEKNSNPAYQKLNPQSN